MAGGDAPAKKGGLLGLLIPVVVLTVVAAGGGAMLGTQIVAGTHAPAPETKPDTKPDVAAAASDAQLKELGPIVTNLTGPDRTAWVRLQAAIVYSKADAAGIDLVASRIGDDILAVLRTLTIADLQGATGLEILREDLTQRASVRSDGHVRELVIQTLVIQ